MQNEFIIFPILIFLSAFFSGAEVALISIDPAKIRTFINEKRRGVKSLSRLKKNSKKMLITILIGNNVVNIAASSMAAVVITQKFGSLGLGIATGLMTFLILVFGEILPKTFANTHSGRVALAVSQPIEILLYLLFPLVLILELFSGFISNLFKVKRIETVTESDIRSIIEIAYEKKVIDINEKILMGKVLNFGKITVSQIMTPISSIFSLNSKEKIKDVLDEISNNGYSRLPIYEGNKNNIVGIVLVKDILKHISKEEANLKLKDISASPLSVSALTHADNLLKFFQNTQEHFTLVKENEKIVGIVSIEDLLEELVGEIVDETDITPYSFVVLEKNTIIAHGLTAIGKINNFFKTDITSGRKYKTINELVSEFTKTPREQYNFTIKNVKFTLIDVDKEGVIKKVKITKKSISNFLSDSIKHIFTFTSSNTSS